MTDQICCNCRYYEGVKGVPGFARCSWHEKMTMGTDASCVHMWPIPEKLRIGKKTNFEVVKAMTAEGLAIFLGDMLGVYPFGSEEWDSKRWLEWLQMEVPDGSD